MFGIGFTELLLISIVAILFLGPDKLPQAMIEMAKFIKSVKKTVGEAKSSLEEEMKIADLKEEALSYKKQLDDATSELKNFKNIDFDDFDDLSYDDEISTKSPKEIAKSAKIDDTVTAEDTSENEVVATPVEAKNDTVTFKKEKKKKKKEAADETTDRPKGEA
ncbi:MAG: Sec-independent protein translocase subunit TatB [Sulfurovum sp.]|uniref:Sec-independent protein translocase protein TatB n=1 Tax=Sulfurovum sp. TaxID=1969726 RepID=UPI002867F697|nr:Sec-independent protein translocase protein TatB [Sulfurovum sp.]MCO4845194.1 Sec-independent protein translocase subunit TatB [Sulfurovum sp.]